MCFHFSKFVLVYILNLFYSLELYHYFLLITKIMVCTSIFVFVKYLMLDATFAFYKIRFLFLSMFIYHFYFIEYSKLLPVWFAELPDQGLSRTLSMIKILFNLKNFRFFDMIYFIPINLYSILKYFIILLVSVFFPKFKLKIIFRFLRSIENLIIL